MDRIKIIGGQRLEGSIPISGAKNAALFAISQLALLHPGLALRLKKFRSTQTKAASANRLEPPKKLRRSR